MLMTFGKYRFDRKHEWELVRFCSKLNTKVIGGAGRLLRRFEEDYKPVSPVSYADRQWSRERAVQGAGIQVGPCFEARLLVFQERHQAQVFEDDVPEAQAERPAESIRPVAVRSLEHEEQRIFRDIRLRKLRVRENVFGRHAVE